MNFVVIILGILYLCGLNVGTALAICSIIECIIVTIGYICQHLADKYS